MNRFHSGKANRNVSHLVRYLCTWIGHFRVPEKPSPSNEARCNTFLMKMSFVIEGWAPTLVLKQRPGGTRKWPITCACESKHWLLHHLHVHSCDFRDITRRTLNSTTGPSRSHTIHTMHISRYNKGMWTNREKTRYTVNKVPPTKNRWRATSSPAIKGGSFYISLRNGWFWIKCHLLIKMFLRFGKAGWYVVRTWCVVNELDNHFYFVPPEKWEASSSVSTKRGRLIYRAR